MKKLIIFILIAGVLGVGGYYGFEWYKGQQEEKIAKLEDKVEFLKAETVPLRFKVLEKDSSQITFAFKFYDQNDIEFNLDTLSLQGQEISFDFYIVPVKDNLKIAFPYKIFTNKIPAKDGKILFDYYDDEGFPQVFSNEGSDEEYISLMSDLFSKIKAGDTEDIEGIYGSMVQDIKQLNEFTVNRKYEIVVHTKGGIEIKEFM